MDWLSLAPNLFAKWFNKFSKNRPHPKKADHCGLLAVLIRVVCHSNWCPEFFRSARVRVEVHLRGPDSLWRSSIENSAWRRTCCRWWGLWRSCSSSRVQVSQKIWRGPHSLMVSVHASQSAAPGSTLGISMKFFPANMKNFLVMPS